MKSSGELQLFYLSLQAKKRPLKHGYLFKRTSKKSSSHDAVRWQRRWCAVYRNMFFYYEHADSAKPQGIIFLEDVYSSHMDAGDGRSYVS